MKTGVQHRILNGAGVCVSIVLAVSLCTQPVLALAPPSAFEQDRSEPRVVEPEVGEGYDPVFKGLLYALEDVREKASEVPGLAWFVLDVGGGKVWGLDAEGRRVADLGELSPRLGPILARAGIRRSRFSLHGPYAPRVDKILRKAREAPVLGMRISRRGFLGSLIGMVGSMATGGPSEQVLIRGAQALLARRKEFEGQETIGKAEVLLFRRVIDEAYGHTFADYKRGASQGRWRLFGAFWQATVEHRMNDAIAAGLAQDSFHLTLLKSAIIHGAHAPLFKRKMLADLNALLPADQRVNPVVLQEVTPGAVPLDSREYFLRREALSGIARILMVFDLQKKVGPRADKTWDGLAKLHNSLSHLLSVAKIVTKHAGGEVGAKAHEGLTQQELQRRLTRIKALHSELTEAPKPPTHVQLRALAERLQLSEVFPGPHLEVLHAPKNNSLYLVYDDADGPWVYQAFPSDWEMAMKADPLWGLVPAETRDVLGLRMKRFERTPEIAKRLRRAGARGTLLSSKRGALLTRERFKTRIDIPHEGPERQAELERSAQELARAMGIHVSGEVLATVQPQTMEGNFRDKAIEAMVRVLRSLIDNAVAAQAESGKPGAIGVEISLHENDLEISVVDHGKELHWPSRPLYDGEIRSFFRSGTWHKRRLPDYREEDHVGLPKALAWVTDNGGFLRAEPTPDGGTRVGFTIPLTISSHEKLALRESPARSHGPVPGPEADVFVESAMLAPPSQLDALMEERNAWIESMREGLGLRKGQAADPDMRGKLSEGELLLVADLVLIFGGDTVEEAIKENPRTWAAGVAERLRRVGFAAYQQSFDRWRGTIPVGVLQHAFANHPRETLDILEMIGKEPELFEWLQEKFGTAWLILGLRNKIGQTRNALQVLVADSGALLKKGMRAVEGGFLPEGAGFTEVFIQDPITVANILMLYAKLPRAFYKPTGKIFAASSYQEALRQNPKSLLRLLGALEKEGLALFSQAAIPARMGGRDPDEDRRIVEADPNAFTAHDGGILFDHLARLVTRWQDPDLRDALNYHREVVSPSVAAPLWGELEEGLPRDATRNRKLRRFAFRLHATTAAVLEGNEHEDVFRLSLTLGKEEIARLQAQGIRLKNPEIGTVQFKREGDRLIVGLIQSLLKDRRERVPNDFMKPYGDWPVLLLLALEDYARAQGVEEIWLPDQEFIYKNMQTARVSKEFGEEVAWLYGGLGNAMGYEETRIDPYPARIAEQTGTMDTVYVRRLDREPSEAVRAFQGLANKDMFLARRWGTREIKADGDALWDTKIFLEDMRQALLENPDVASSPARTALLLRTAWDSQATVDDELLLNYSLEDQGVHWHGVQIAGVDMVLRVESDGTMTYAQRRFPHIVELTPEEETQGLGADSMAWDMYLKKWPMESALRWLPTMRRWAAAYERSPYRHAWLPHLHQELGRFLGEIPKRQSAAVLDRLMRVMDEQMNSLAPSDRILFLRMATPIVEGAYRWSDSMDQPLELVGILASVQRARVGPVGANVASRLSKAWPKDDFWRGYFPEARKIMTRYPPGQRRDQALVVFSVAWISSSVHAPSLVAGAMAFFDKVLVKAPVSLKSDLLLHWLNLIPDAIRESPQRQVTEAFFISALEAIAAEQDPDPKAFNTMLEYLLLWDRGVAGRYIRDGMEELRKISDWGTLAEAVRREALKDREREVVQAIEAGHVTTHSDMPLMIGFADRIRDSEPISLRRLPWPLHASFMANNSDYPVLEIHPQGLQREKKHNPVVDMFGWDLQDGRFLHAPRGAPGMIRITIAPVDGKMTLFVWERQAAKGVFALPGNQRDSMERWRERTLRRIFETAEAMPEIFQVFALSDRQLEAINEERLDELDINKLAIRANYARTRTMKKLGMRYMQKTQMRDLVFGGTVAFGLSRVGGKFLYKSLAQLPDRVRPPRLYSEPLWADRVMPKDTFHDDWHQAHHTFEGYPEKRGDSAARLVRAAKNILLKDKRYPYGTHASWAKVWPSVDFEPTDVRFDHLNAEFPPAVWISHDMFEHLHNRFLAGDETAAYALADLIHQYVTLPKLFVEAVLERGKDSRESGERLFAEAKALAEGRAPGKRDLFSQRKRKAMRRARAKYQKEENLRQGLLEISTAEERLRIVARARGARLRADALRYPSQLARLGKEWNFPMHLIAYGKRSRERLREIQKMPPEKRFAEVFRLLLYYRQWSLEDLEEATGVATPRLRDLLHGRRKPRQEELEALAEALGASVHHLKTGYPEPLAPARRLDREIITTDRVEEAA